MSKQKLEYIQTGDMTHEEIADWENKNEAVSICFDNSGNLEMQIVCSEFNIYRSVGIRTCLFYQENK